MWRDTLLALAKSLPSASPYGTPLCGANRLINVVQDWGRWTHVRRICYTLQRDCWSVLCEKDRLAMQEGT